MGLSPSGCPGDLINSSSFTPFGLVRSSFGDPNAWEAGKALQTALRAARPTPAGLGPWPSENAGLGQGCPFPARSQCPKDLSREAERSAPPSSALRWQLDKKWLKPGKSMFLENVGGTFPGPHLVVSSGGPTPSTVTPELKSASRSHRHTCCDRQPEALPLGPAQSCYPWASQQH